MIAKCLLSLYYWIGNGMVLLHTQNDKMTMMISWRRLCFMGGECDYEPMSFVAMLFDDVYSTLLLFYAADAAG